MKADLRGNPTSFLFQNPNLFVASSQPSSDLTGALRGCSSLGSLDGACTEKLLLHCASALEANDVTLAQQVMWVLNNVASPTGDPNQRLTSWFLRALVSRASRVCPNAPVTGFGGGNGVHTRLMTVTELAGYVDVIPWHRFGFCAANSEILRAVQGQNRVHILDFSITHCMQWPTLIDALAKRPEGPPFLRISVMSGRPPVPPLLNASCEQLGVRLANFAKFRDVPFEFNVIGSESDYIHQEFPDFHHNFILSCLTPSCLNLRPDEVLAVNCQNWLRYLPSRDTFIDAIKGLNPSIVTIVDEDCDLGGSSLVSRITTCFNYLWIPFDALETFLPKDSPQRIEYEADIGHKIENIIGFEGDQRIERLESGMKLSQRMKNNGFLSAPFCEDTIREVKSLLDEHASGWGMKVEDEMLVLTWKGHSAVYATTWVVSPQTQVDIEIKD
ncbi:scarecrow-like protein 32 [Ipomoea triloba]|uniref:scarecrow-like protein 32 n=1 Tax=Ipomoea triloba TaxID=35885 RepID=UPI00125DA7BC|nr:scarecrow-like protein 32 [Ipomoea triloba]